MNEKQIDTYLFNEMSEAEREKVEDSFVGDDDLFYEIVERENELVDKYVAGGLSGRELERFERSVEALPARRKKVSNARTLREFVGEERSESPAITPSAELSGFFSRLFSFGPALQFASVGVIVILAFASIFLWTENRRLGSLEQQLAMSRQRESELAQQAENERQTSGDLTTDLDAERERIQKLEAEIARLKETNADTTPPSNPVAPTVATLILSPVGIRGGPPPSKHLELARGVSRVSTILNLDIANTERVSVRLNGESIAENVTVQMRGGGKSVSLAIAADSLKEGRNSLAVFDAKGDQIQEFAFTVSRRK